MELLHSNSRHVRHVRFRTPRSEYVPRVATMLEDALRTASLPRADSRQIILIRRLALGRIDPRGSPASLALSLERAVRQVRLSATPGSSPNAALAEVVEFRDYPEIVSLLARKIARGSPLTEWFWPAALRTSPSQISGIRWLSLLRLAQSLPAPVFCAAAIIQQAIESRVLAHLIVDLPRGTGAEWLRAAGFFLESDESFPPLAFNEPYIKAALHSLVGVFSPDDDRVLWAASMAAIAENPRRAGDSILPARVHALLNSLSNLTKPTPRSENGPLPEVSHRPPFSSELPVPPDSFPPPRAQATVARERPPTRQETPAKPSTARTNGDETQLGGLFFLVPILHQLGFREWLASEDGLAEAGYGVALLQAVTQRLARQRLDDPVIRHLGEAAPPPEEFFAPKTPLPAAARLFSVTNPRGPSRPFSAWIDVLRRWSRTQLRLGLYSLIVRPGHLFATRTHLDIHFTLEQSDTRIRRHALDLDPGWVPWLGRIIHFHYDDNCYH